MQFYLYVCFAFLLHRTFVIFWRLLFHPLARFPGPRLAAATSLYRTYHEIIRGGEFVNELRRMHTVYGMSIISPNWLIHVLSFRYGNSNRTKRGISVCPLTADTAHKVDSYTSTTHVLTMIYILSNTGTRRSHHSIDALAWISPRSVRSILMKPKADAASLALYSRGVLSWMLKTIYKNM